MKKFILLSMVVFLMMAGTVHAEGMTTYTEGTLYYTIQNESITITGYFGKDEQVQVPSSIAGYPVNVIGKNAFTSNAYVKKVVLPDTITQVEEGAFHTDVAVDYSNVIADNNNQNNPEAGKDDSNTQNNPGTGKEDSNTQKDPGTGKEDSNTQKDPETGKDDSNTQKDPGFGNTDTSQKNDKDQVNNTGSSKLTTGKDDITSEGFGRLVDTEEQAIVEEADVILTEEAENFVNETTETTGSAENDTIAEAEKAESDNVSKETDGKSNAPIFILALSVLAIAAIGVVVWKRMKK